MKKGFGILAIIAAIAIGFFFYAKNVGAQIIDPNQTNPASGASLAATGAAALFKTGKDALTKLFKGGLAPAGGAAATGVGSTLISAGVAAFVGFWVLGMTGKLFGMGGLFGRQETDEELGASLGWNEYQLAQWKAAKENGTMETIVSVGSLKAPTRG